MSDFRHMRIFRHMRNLVGVIIICVGVSWLSATAPAPVPKGKEVKAKLAEATSSEEIQKTLNKSVSLEYTNQELENVLNLIGKDHKMKIMLDHSQGLPDSPMVDISVKNVPLRDGLRSMLRQFGLAYFIVGNRLIVTSEERGWGLVFQQTVNLHLKGEPFEKVIDDLRKNHALNILIDPRLKKKNILEMPITFDASDIYLETALRLLCDQVDMVPIRMGNLIYITDEARATKLKKNDWLDPNRSNSILISESLRNPSLDVGIEPKK